MEDAVLILFDLCRILKRVRMIVEGCAWAKAVWCSVCVRNA